jgi:hypothetical protein
MMKSKPVVSVILAVVFAGCAVHGPARPGPQADDGSGAVVANAWYAPGRAILCGTSALLAGLVMTITFGNLYDSASTFMHGACSGPWTLDAEDIRNAVP